MVLPPPMSLTPSTLLNRIEKALPQTPVTPETFCQNHSRIFLLTAKVFEFSYPWENEEGFPHISWQQFPWRTCSQTGPGSWTFRTLPSQFHMGWTPPSLQDKSIIFMSVYACTVCMYTNLIIIYLPSHLWRICWNNETTKNTNSQR